MKLQKTSVFVTAFLMAMVSPQVWAFGPGGHGGGHGGGPGGFHGGGGGRGGGFRCGPGHGGRGGWGGRCGPGWGGRWNRCGGGGGWCGGGGYNGGYIWSYPYAGYGYGGYGGYGYGGYGADTPNYVINYSPYITTGATMVPTVTTAPGVVAESTTCAAPTVSGDLVGNVQRALRQRGFYKGPIDGISGPPTRAAIRAYAGCYGLPATGIIDSQLLASLGLL